MRRGIARRMEDREFLYAVGVDVAVEVGAEGAEQDEKVDDIHGSVAVEFACTDQKRPILKVPQGMSCAMAHIPSRQHITLYAL